MRHWIVVCLLMTIATFLQACGASRDGKPAESLAIFTGQAVSTFGRPVGATGVTVNGVRVDTDRQGHFAVQVRAAAKYVVNVRKEGFGLVSRIYQRGVQDARYILPDATRRTADAAKPIVVVDSASEARCRSLLSRHMGRRPVRPQPASGRSMAGSANGVADAGLRQALARDPKDIKCGTGISIAIPANALVDADGRPPAGHVEVSLTTANLFFQDGVPGDNTVAAKDKKPAFLQSIGGGTVDVTAGGRRYTLKPGKTATLTVPVDPNRLGTKEMRNPKTAAFFSYDAAKGVWRRDGTARLNEKGDAYTATVRHLSEYNMGFTGPPLTFWPSCVKFLSTGMDGAYGLRTAYRRRGGDVVFRDFLVSNPDKPHALYNLPNNTDVGMQAYWSHGGNRCNITDPVVVNSGPRQRSIQNPPGPPYFACRQSSVPVLTRWVRWPWSPSLSGTAGAPDPQTGNAQISLQWSYNFRDCKASGHLIELQESTGLGWVQIPTAGVENPLPAIFRPAGTYRYRIRMRDSSLWTRWSPVVSLTLAALDVTPLAPTSLTAEVLSSSAIRLTWVDNATNETAYVVEYRKVGDVDWIEIPEGRLAANATQSPPINNLEPGTAYEFQVAAVNFVPTPEAISAYATVTAATLAAPTTPPPVPTGLSATAISAEVIRLRWTGVGGEVDGYFLERRVPGGTWDDRIPVGGTSFMDFGRTAAATYQYRVSAHNLAGASNPSAIVSATTWFDLTGVWAGEGVVSAVNCPVLCDTRYDVSIKVSDQYFIGNTDEFVGANATPATITCPAMGRTFVLTFDFTGMIDSPDMFPWMNDDGRSSRGQSRFYVHENGNLVESGVAGFLAELDPNGNEAYVEFSAAGSAPGCFYDGTYRLAR